MSMNENHPLMDPNSSREVMRKNIFRQMLVGSGVAAGVILVPAAFIFFFYIVGEFLPPESKEAVDPSPDSFGQAE